MDERKLNRIKQIASSARSEIKRMHKDTNGWDYDRYDLGGACGIASYLLHEVLTKRGIRSRLVHGEFEGGTHFWVEVGPKIVDITHTQFTSEAPKVAVFPKKRKGFRRHTRYTREAKQELYTWPTYKNYRKRLDSAKRRLLKRYGA